jgi:glutaredoxin
MWVLPVVFLAFGAVIAGEQIADGSPVAGVGFGLVFVVIGYWFSPLAFPRHVPAAVARRRAAEEGRAIVYWRPGCPYCAKLRLRLIGRARHATWVNIWRDPDAAAAVREVADGNETVPTVVAGGEARVNPDPAWVRRQLAGAVSAPPR